MADDIGKARPAERRVFREEIREQLIDDILSGRLAPGSKIVETRLAQQLTTTFVTHSMTTLTHRTLHEIGERPLPVLGALWAHDPDRAEAEMRRHIEEPGDWIRQAASQEQGRVSKKKTKKAVG